MPTDHPDESRVLRIRVVRDIAEGTYSLGSGYVLTDGFALTAAHVLEPAENVAARKGQPAEVLAFDGTQWQAATVEWVDATNDVAILHSAACRADSPVPWGRLTGSSEVSWRAIGYPTAGRSEHGRHPETTFGLTPPSGERPAGQLALTVNSRQPAGRSGGESGWEGLSGAAVFCAEHLVGVMLSVPARWQRSLTARRVEAFSGSQDLAALLGSAPVLEDVPAPSPSPPATGRVVLEVNVLGTGRDIAQPAPAPPLPAAPVEVIQPQPAVELPVPAPTFSADRRRIIGRAGETAALSRLLKRGDRRLVTLWGPPGVGKSRLASAVARTAASEFPERIWNVRLEAIPPGADFRLVTQQMMEFLRMPDVQSQDSLDVLSNSLGQHPCLLILDNCEHVIVAAAEIAEFLVSRAAGLRVLATSQKPLEVEGELEFEISPLELDDAARLFMDLAWEGRKAPAQPDDAAIRDICEKVDRIPLAVGLAAARVRDGYAIGEIRDGLKRSLSVLVDAPQHGNPRHRAMETALDWSYQLLDEDAQRMLRVASIFAAPFDRRAAGFMFGQEETGLGSSTDTALRTLRRGSLIQADGGLFSWLETIRQYGESKLQQSGEAGSARERYARYVLAMAETAASHAYGREELLWLDRLDANRNHLRAALTILAARPQDIELRWRLAVALEIFWLRRDYLEWGSDELTRLLAASAVQGRPRAVALVAAGRIARRRGDLAAARTLLAEALDIARTLQNPGLEASALEASGFLEYETGDDEAARPRLEEALRKARAAGLRWLERAALSDLGLIARRSEDFAEAERLLNESLAIAEELGDVIGRGHSLNNLGLTRLDQEDYARAREELEEALRLLTDAGGTYVLAHIRLNLALVAAAERRFDEAAALLRDSLADARRAGATGLVAAAEELTGWAEETRAGDQRTELSATESSAALVSALGHYETALELYRGLGRGDDAQRMDAMIAECEAAIAPLEVLPPPGADLLRLEAVLAVSGTQPDPELVRAAIQAAQVYTLGHPVDEPGEGGQSDLLHFAIDDDDGTELVMLPIFTRSEIMQDALLRNPDWQALSVLEVNGRALLDNIDSDVNVVVNPWSPGEFVLYHS